MPPKDDKKKKPPPRPECIHPVEVHLPDEMSPEFYLNQIAELEICVERYQELYKTVLQKSEELQDQLSEQKQDSKNAFIEAKQELQDKVSEITNLEDELKELEETIEREKEDHEALMKQKNQEYEDTEKELTDNNQEILDKLAVIEEFKLEREELEERIKSLEEEIAQRAELQQAQIEEQDRQQIDAKNKLKKDIVTHLSDVAGEYRRKVDVNMPLTTKRLFLENYQLNSRVLEFHDEIQLLRQQSVEWKAEDQRQIRRIRSLETTNADVTNKNITIKMVMELMHEKIASLNESIERYRPRDAAKRSTLAEELQYLHEQLVQSRDMLVSSTQRKEELEKDVFEQRYALGVQRSTCIQLQKCFDNTTLAVSRFIQREVKGDCVDLDPSPEPRPSIIVSFLMILQKARQHRVGPSLRDIVHPPEADVCKYRGYRRTDRYADEGYEPGDLGIVPRPRSRLPTARDGMKRLIAARRTQARMLMDELSRKPTDPTTSSIVRVRFFGGRRDSDEKRAALAASRAKYLLSSKPTQTSVLPPISTFSQSTANLQ